MDAPTDYENFIAAGAASLEPGTYWCIVHPDGQPLKETASARKQWQDSATAEAEQAPETAQAARRPARRPTRRLQPAEKKLDGGQRYEDHNGRA